ncbi:MAG: serine/threonine protein kinase [Verrucomicrobiae bacterium]|nr:serine/threonine protein kinase [Verrucomicrobiae bacterium]
MKPLNEREIFLEALELPTPEARAAYLQGACGHDVTLRREVDKLLKEHYSDDSLLAGPALEGERVSEAGPPASESPAQVIGRYKLLEKIGEGGFGEVWMAEQREPVKRRVAVKIIKLGMDSRQIVARFEAERQALAMMDHPNIAKIFDAGTTEPSLSGSSGRESAQTSTDEDQSRLTSAATIGVGRPYFVMELVRGIKITEYCDQNQLPTRERLNLFILVCQAIQHAHQKGMIHRDIKPSNILVTLHDGVPVPKVIDFGIAKATQGELTDKTVFTQFQQFIGTPAYISPEQAEMSGLDIDTRADIYSLGVLLYELLVGQTPFDAKEMMKGGLDALRQIIREKEPLRPSTKLSQTLVAANVSSLKSPGRKLATEEEVRADSRRLLRVKESIALLRGDLDWIVMKCLEKDRTRRYETANGLAADIQRHLANEPVVARPPSATYKLQKAWQRNKLVFTAGAVVAVALVAGIGVSAWQAIRATRATKGEFQQRVAAQTAQTKAEDEQRRADAQARKASESEQNSRRFLYAADINLAQQSLKQNNLGKARRLLERHRPQPGEEDLRGWEWRYLWQLTRSSALVTLTNRPTPGISVSFSPDGTRLAVSWWDGRVDLWDVPGRRWIRALTDRHPGRLAFSPVRNLLAGTSEPNVVTLYDLDSDRQSLLWRAPYPGAWDVRDLSFSQDGSRVVIYAGTAYDKRGTSTGSYGDQVWLVNVASSQIESRHPTLDSRENYFGAAQLSPDNRRLYVARSEASNRRYNIQCLDLATDQELWQTEPQQDHGLTTLALSPDGRVLASGSGHEDPTIRVWEAATGQLLRQLDGHTGWVCKLAFTRDGRRLISAATDQTIRIWDINSRDEPMVLRGHTDEVYAVAISESAQLVASASKDGDLVLWKEDGKSVTDGYRRLGSDPVLPLDHSRVLLLPPGQPPELVDLKRDSPRLSLPEVGASANVLGWFGTNALCHWDGTNQIVVRELRSAEFVQRGAITLDSGMRPTGFAYNPARQFLAWTEAASSTSLHLASLAEPGRRTELRSDVPGLVPLRFSEDGNYLAAWIKEWEARDTLRVWHVQTGQIVVSINQRFHAASFAAGGRVLVAALARGNDHEIGFYDLAYPDRAPQRVRGKQFSDHLAVSPDGRLVASSTGGGQIRLFDPTKGELIGTLDGHLNAAFGLAFSPDGRRLISASGGREAVKLWDVGTRQELLTLAGTGSVLKAGWSADGDVIFAGSPGQAWSAPSWEEIAAAEAKEKTGIKKP